MRVLPTFTLMLAASLAHAQQPVRVILDIDAATPGIQSSITVAPGTQTVQGIAVYIYDPKGTRSARAIGYAGGLDRGMAIGHSPSNLNVGTLASFTGHVGTPVIGGFNYLTTAIEKGFDGPELHYLEFASQMVTLPSAPLAPAFTIDAHLTGAAAGDDFRIYLLDMVTVWRSSLGAGSAGAFWTTPNGLDTGGDCVPDGTVSSNGIDFDSPVPVPPASFLVDYIDGQGGARILIGSTCYANCDRSTGSPLLTANDFTCFINAFVNTLPYANCDGSTAAPVLTSNDFICFVNSYAAGCP